MSDEKSAAYKIFHQYFRCYIPQHHLYSKDFIETFGLPTSGDREIDRELANSDTLSQLTIADMAGHLANGANMTLEDPKKSVIIYRIIREHLLDWKAVTDDPIDTTPPPVEDLRELDALAVEVYKVAKGFMAQDDGGSRFFRSLSGLESRRAMSRFTPEESTQFTVPKEHKLISDTIAKTTFKNTHRWR